MKNIILLGSKGKVGKSYYKKYSNLHNIFSDKNFKLNQLLNIDFIEKNKIDCFINCIGSYKDEELFFHSNYFLPLVIAQALIEFTKKYSRNIIFVHLSSIGVNDPYGRLTLEPIKLDVLKRKSLYFNNYELSKCCADFHLKHVLKNHEFIKLFIFQPSVVLVHNSRFLLKLYLFLFFFPFNLINISKPPFTKIDDLTDQINRTLTQKSNYYNLVQVFERISLNELFPKYRFICNFKLLISRKDLKRIIRILSRLKIFNAVVRILKFLCLL